MPRFALLEHVGSPRTPGRVHWDLLLEHEGSLKTWELAALPVAGKTVAAVPLPDHRLAYLDAAGPVAGDRGHVSRVDGGSFETSEQGPDRWIVQLAGAHYRGTLDLQRTPGTDQWRAVLSDP